MDFFAGGHFLTVCTVTCIPVLKVVGAVAVGAVVRAGAGTGAAAAASIRAITTEDEDDESGEDGGASFAGVHIPIHTLPSSSSAATTIPTSRRRSINPQRRGGGSRGTAAAAATAAATASAASTMATKSMGKPHHPPYWPLPLETLTPHARARCGASCFGKDGFARGFLSGLEVLSDAFDPLPCHVR
jgi:hypothetical protein